MEKNHMNKEIKNKRDLKKISSGVTAIQYGILAAGISASLLLAVNTMKK